jgi:hypothetical protein
MLLCSVDLYSNSTCVWLTQNIISVNNSLLTLQFLNSKPYGFYLSYPSKFRDICVGEFVVCINALLYTYLLDLSVFPSASACNCPSYF